MHNCRLLLLALAAVGIALPAQAQTRGYVGGAMSVMAQPLPAEVERLGGTTWSGSVVVGAQVSRRWSVEFEPTFGGDVAAKTYTYRPSLDRQVEVASEGRDTFLTFQLRSKAGVLEPVAGVSYVRSSVHSHATFVPGGQTYFDGESSRGAVAVAGGLDAALGRSPRFAIVPTVRVFIVRRGNASPPTAQTVVLRAGVGARVAF
jgi:hypothetical protein